MAQKPLSILISGAGVAGASLALMLARQPSFKCKPIITLVERTATTRSTGQAIDIRGPAVEVINKLGLEPTIKSKHTQETGFALVDSHGAPVAQFNATGDPKNQSMTSEYEILRSDLVGLLLDGVEEAKAAGANVNVVYGESISSLENTPSGVNVTFTNGKLKPQTYDVVLGADGSGSKVRSLIFGKDNNARKPSGMYVAFYTIPRIAEDENLYKIAILPNGLSMHLRPHGNGKTMGCYLAIMKTTATSDPEMDAVLKEGLDAQKKFFQEKFRSTGWQDDRFTNALDDAEDFYATHWCQVRTQKWYEERTALLGDAGFATMGIGTSFALISAYILAGELAKIESPAEVNAALAKYQELFKPFVDKHSYSSGGMGKVFPQSAWGISVAHFLVRAVAFFKIPQMAMWAFGGESRETWKLPEYGWEEKAKI